MLGIYIFIFILLLLIFYFVFINIKSINDYHTINKLIEITTISNISKINNLDNIKKNSLEDNSNILKDNSNNDIINMNSVDSIGNIYNDYYNNIDYSGKINPYDNNYKPPKLNKLRKCQIPTLNTEQCYKSRYYECPIVNGTYLQCTNNYIPKPSEYNADCGNRTFDMTPYPWKISENCYYDKIDFDRNKEFNPIKYY